MAADLTMTRVSLFFYPLLIVVVIEESEKTSETDYNTNEELLTIGQTVSIVEKRKTSNEEGGQATGNEERMMAFGIIVCGYSYYSMTRENRRRSILNIQK